MTAIREVDLACPIERLADLHGATRCMVVLRWHRRVVGRIVMPVIEGAIPADTLLRAIERNVGREALDAWLDDALDYDERRHRTTRRPSIAVAICTRERPDDLANALRAVRLLQLAPDETLVVDNAPESDATRNVVERFPGVRYLREARRGLDAARNRALRELTTDVVAFSDDDAVPEPEWLTALQENFTDPRIACASGLTLPLVLDTTARELFEEHCSFVRGFRRRVFDGQRDNPLAVGQVGAGANMAVRRETVLQLGGFDERLDAGTPTHSGGDHELFTRVLARGYRIAYDPSAVSHHRHRATDRELFDTVYGYGVGVYAMWTGLLLERGEIGVLKLAWRWFRADQLPVLCGRGRPDAVRLARVQWRGCLRGPAAWLAARRMERRHA